MNNGKLKCEALKKIRQSIADSNGIDYHTTECKHQGDCPGTCPKCDQEVRYLESELARRQSSGLKVTVAGLALGVSVLASCGACNQGFRPFEVVGDVAMPVDSAQVSDTVDVVPVELDGDVAMPLDSVE